MKEALAALVFLASWALADLLLYQPLPEWVW